MVYHHTLPPNTFVGGFLEVKGQDPFYLKENFKRSTLFFFFFSVITYSQTMFTLKEMYHLTDVPSHPHPPSVREGVTFSER